MSHPDRTAVLATLEHLRRLAAANDDRIPTSALQASAVKLGLSPRSLWRYLKDGVPEPQSRPPLCDDHFEAISRNNGRLKAAWKELAADGKYQNGYRQFVRDFNQLEPIMRKGLKNGVTAGIGQGLFLKSHKESRLSRVIFDHTEADIRLQRLHRGRHELYRPWVTLLLDSATRMILAIIITEGEGLRGDPNTESLVALMALAIRGHEASDGTFVGGIPRLVQCDNAKAHMAEAMLSGFITLGIAIHLIKPGSPWEDGKVERLMRTFNEEVLSSQPGYTKALEDRYARDPWAPQDCLTTEEFTALLLKWMDFYNYERVHTSLGCTPFDAWRSDPQPIERADDGLIRSSFLAQTRPVAVSKNGVRFKKVDYTAKELRHQVGKKATLRYLPNDPSFVDVYVDGVYICTARPHERLSREQRNVIVKERNAAARKVDRITKQSRRRRVEATLEGNPLLAPERDPELPASSIDAFDEDEDFLSFAERASGTPTAGTTPIEEVKGPLPEVPPINLRENGR